MPTSYSHCKGDYRYDIEIHDAAPVALGRYCARVVNLVRLESGRQVSVDVDLHGAYGATRDEACSRIEGRVEAWVNAR
jgi:hypothetical protein